MHKEELTGDLTKESENTLSTLLFQTYNMFQEKYIPHSLYQHINCYKSLTVSFGFFWGKLLH